MMQKHKPALFTFLWQRAAKCYLLFTVVGLLLMGVHACVKPSDPIKSYAIGLDVTGYNIAVIQIHTDREYNVDNVPRLHWHVDPPSMVGGDTVAIYATQPPTPGQTITATITVTDGSGNVNTYTQTDTALVQVSTILPK